MTSELLEDHFEFRAITAPELDVSDIRQEWRIEEVMTKGEPLIIAGGKKCLKTNSLVEACVSLAYGREFFNHFYVFGQTRVALMSGESGLATLKETSQRVCRFKGFSLSDVTNLIFSPDLPQVKSEK